jgi:23S rRNA (adenine-N6)-dimethyltransferase
VAAARSRRAWGWHALTAEWARRIVADAPIRPGDLILDVGAGTGALTEPLVRAGARVLAIELHPRRAALLRHRFAGAAVTVVEVDARELLLPHRPFRVVANPPYGISNDLLRILTARGSRLLTAHLVLQQQFVRKTVDRQQAGRRWSFEAGRPLPRNAFQPAPLVDSAVLVIRAR